jgi:membrane-associated protease RseP (regulator of RpoE activity)
LQVVTAAGGREAVVELSGDPRPISILGIVRIGGDIGAERGLAALAVVLASVNLVLALINLAPLLPFDGGHAAVATYEAVRGALRRGPYRVDMAKLMPVTYAVVALLMFVGLTSMWIDLRNPVELP